MRRILTIFSILLIVSCEQKSYRIIETSSGDFSDFLILNKNVIALTDKGRILKISNDSITTLTSNAVSISKRSDSEIYYLTSDGGLNTLNINSRTKVNLAQLGSLTGLIQPVDTSVFIITPKSIINTQTEEEFEFKDAKRYNEQFNIIGALPSHVCTDSSDNLWLGWDLGEWGGELQAFDIQNKRFIELEDNSKISLNAVSSIVPTNNGVISTHVNYSMGSGLVYFENYKSQHYIYPSDTIYLMEHNGDSAVVFDSGFEIGPACLNQKNNHLAFYSNGVIMSGIFELSSNNEKWQPIISLRDFEDYGFGETYTTWWGATRFSTNSQMIKLRMLADQQFVFLTHNGELGILTPKSLTLYDGNGG